MTPIEELVSLRATAHFRSLDLESKVSILNASSSTECFSQDAIFLHPSYLLSSDILPVLEELSSVTRVRVILQCRNISLEEAISLLHQVWKKENGDGYERLLTSALLYALEEMPLTVFCRVQSVEEAHSLLIPAPYSLEDWDSVSFADFPGEASEPRFYGDHDGEHIPFSDVEEETIPHGYITLGALQPCISLMEQKVAASRIQRWYRKMK